MIETLIIIMDVIHQLYIATTINSQKKKNRICPVNNEFIPTNCSSKFMKTENTLHEKQNSITPH